MPDVLWMMRLYAGNLACLNEGKLDVKKGGNVYNSFMITLPKISLPMHYILLTS